MKRAIVFISRLKWRHIHFHLAGLCLALLVYMSYLWLSAPRVKLNFIDDTRVTRFTGQKWRLINKFCSKKYYYDSAILKSPAGNINMYVRSSHKSLSIATSGGYTGVWHKASLLLLYEQLESDPNMGLLDIGARLGDFTLTAALMGHKVTALDSDVENVARLCRSIRKNGLVDYVTLALAILSGTSKIEEGSKESVDSKYLRYPNGAIHLNDLIYVIDFGRVIMKLDVDRNVFFVLTCAKNLFLRLDIRGVIMRWNSSEMNGMADLVIDFFSVRQFLPFSVIWRDHLLNPRLHNKWPSNVFWKNVDIDKRKYQQV